MLLAKIVEIVSGQSFREYCDKNIFVPLKMKHSFCNDNPKALIAERANAYYSDGDSFSFDQNNGMSQWAPVQCLAVFRI